MSSLLVLYDSSCPFCERCRGWLESQAQAVPLAFLCCRSELARDRFGGLPLGEELVVLDRGGHYWVGSEAFVMCLWALHDHRDLALSLGEGWLGFTAEAFFGLVSDHRGLLGRLVGVECHGACGVEPATGSPYR